MKNTPRHHRRKTPRTTYKSQVEQRERPIFEFGADGGAVGDFAGDQVAGELCFEMVLDEMAAPQCRGQVPGSGLAFNIVPEPVRH